MTAPAVAVEDLWVSYRTRNRFGWRRGEGRWALRGLDLAVPRGYCLGVIGGNGSGKTTLLQTVAGVIQPTRGHIAVTGRVASLVDLSAGFHRDLTGRENVLIGGVLLGLSRREVRERQDEIVAFSGLTSEALGWPLAAYSAGMGLRLGFSLVVHSRPDVLLVDEVLAVGDEAFQQQCLERVDQLRSEGCAVIVVSHDMDLVRTHCEEVAVLDDGHMVVRTSPHAAVEAYHEHGGMRGAAAAQSQLFGVRGKTKASRRVKGVL